MLIEDLHHIFKNQIDAKEKLLYFMLIDNDYKVIERHPMDDLAGLLPMLSCFTYSGADAGMPRFKK